MAFSGIKTNIEKLTDAIDLYKQIVKKNADDAARKKMADIAFRAAKNTTYTSKELIRSEISNLPNTNDSGRKRYGNGKFVGQYKLINWERKNKGLPTLGGGARKIVGGKSKKVGSRLFGLGVKSNIYSMQGKYKKFIQSRIRSIKFLRAAWGLAASFFGKSFERGDFGEASLARFSGKAYGGGAIKPVSENIIEYSMFNGAGKWDTRFKPVRQRSSQDQEKAAKIIEDGLSKGIEEVLADINQYFERHTEEIDKVAKNLNTLK